MFICYNYKYKISIIIIKYMIKYNYNIYNYILIYFKKITSKLGFFEVYLNSSKISILRT